MTQAAFVAGYDASCCHYDFFDHAGKWQGFLSPDEIIQIGEGCTVEEIIHAACSDPDMGKMADGNELTLARYQQASPDIEIVDVESLAASIRVGPVAEAVN